MRTLVLLACVSLVVAQEKPFLAGAECGVNVGDATTALVEGSTHLYHSIKDCQVAMAPGTPEAHKKNSFTCTADVFDLVASVAEMSKYTVNIFGDCFDQHFKQSVCVKSGLGLSQHVSEIAASMAEFETACFDRMGRAPDARELKGVKCAVDVKKAMKFSLDTVSAATTIKERCDYSATSCTRGIFNGIGSIAGVAEYVLAAFGDCGSQVPINTKCGRNIAKLVKSLAGVAKHSISVKGACTNYTSFEKTDTSASTALDGFGDGLDKAFDKDKLKDDLGMLVGAAAQAARKYDARGKVPDASASSGVSLANAVLFAAIPVALTIGFFGGRRSRVAKVATKEREEDDSMAADPLVQTMSGSDF